MRALLASPRGLLALSILAVAGLMAMSDFSPSQVSSIGDLDEDPAAISAIALSCRPCAGGFLLLLSDGAGGEATAFCPSDLLSGAVPDGTLVRVTVQRSADDPDFLYVKEISQGKGTGKD
ncbi:MAG: hypothetical protein ISF22_11345 [Methanomassiliicoccus sp.]|nr:hypothetical protein [Methanomassiliicoccus sp.]